MKTNANSFQPASVQRLYFETYLQMVHNAIGTKLFRNFYVRTDAKGRFDALDDGRDACAFFVSGVLVMFGVVTHVHGTVTGTIADLETSGWELLTNKKPQAGDVLLWEAREYEGVAQTHIGFSIGSGRAISNSYKTGTPVEHDETFGDQHRAITHVYRYPHWDS